jgi:hypothetical protein
MLKKVLITLAAVLIIAAGIFYYCCVSRVWIHQEKHGWVLDFSHVRVACPTCTGRVERLEWGGHPIAVPKVPWNQTPRFTMYTPVGMFEAWRPEWGWRARHWDSRTWPVNGVVTEAELAQGYYELDKGGDSTDADGPTRKRGTPDHWCLIIGEVGSRWLAPDKIDQISWERTKTDSTGSSEAE